MEELCTACLCPGRKLYFLNETGLQDIYTQIITEIPVYNVTELCVQVCWECKALLRKVGQFKDQVKRCYMELLQFVQQNTTKPFPSFPHLQTHSLPSISYPDLIKAEPCPLEDYTIDDDVYEQELDVKSETHEEPETFVKDFNSEQVEKVEKPIKKSKKKLKIKPQKAVKKKVKLKKTPVTEERQITVESIIDSTVNDCFSSREDDKRPVKAEIEAESNGDINIPKPKVMKEQLSDKPVCGECGKSFSSRKTYRYHLNVLHKGQNRYPCPRCGKVYQWKSNLGRHMRTHKARDSGELYCETCDKKFASVATYRQHLRISRRHVSESEFSFMCNECGKKFVNKTRLRDHIDWDHLKKIKFKCNLCNKPFKCHTSLYVHVQNVHGSKDKKENLCHVCGKSYQNAAKLKYHIVAMHTSETPYQCEQCNAAFGWYSSLYRHVREVHYKMKGQPKKSKKTKNMDALPSMLPSISQPLLPLQGPT
ncbi:uncharacterized protein LOC142985592 [Anticarsia gemmatalis]|uniref:uncharacterized protein LOC142985592 n=1 Tax=Anticarsia gemmatalis TaxID=129554 RepID=UPI003F763A70